MTNQSKKIEKIEKAILWMNADCGCKIYRSELTEQDFYMVNNPDCDKHKYSDIPKTCSHICLASDESMKCVKCGYIGNPIKSDLTKCLCVMSGFADTTNNCPIHRIGLVTESKDTPTPTSTEWTEATFFKIFDQADFPTLKGDFDQYLRFKSKTMEILSTQRQNLIKEMGERVRDEVIGEDTYREATTDNHGHKYNADNDDNLLRADQRLSLTKILDEMEGGK